MREMTVENESRQTLTETYKTRDGQGLTIRLPVSLESVPKNVCTLHACHRHGVGTFTCRLAHEADQRRSTTVQIKTILGVDSCTAFTAPPGAHMCINRACVFTPLSVTEDFHRL